jgi:hypothetical protein
VRGDETQLTGAGDEAPRVRKGPRHAAPKKSLLTKFQMPAGKAMALAAMPTAVFVTLGLTPKLALAEDSNGIPFAPGPCVTRSDEPDKPEESEKPSETPSASETPEATPKPSPTSGGEAAEPKPTATPSATEATKQAEEPTLKAGGTPTPSASESINPLDPLGVGDAIKDLFGIEDKESASPSPTSSESTPVDEEPGTDGSDDSGGSSEGSKAPDTSSGGKGKEESRSDSVADKIKEAADKAGETVEELDDSVKDTEENPLDETGTEDGEGKERFPCPTADPEALAAADLESVIPALPDDPWILQSSWLTLNGLDYKGIVEVRTGSGKIKKVLKFTAKSIDIENLHQLVVGPNGTTIHAQARKGSTSKMRNGTVTMYTEKLKGNLFGIIPVTFSPEHPPPLNLPFVFFTNAKVTQIGQFGGTLTVPGLHNYITD